MPLARLVGNPSAREHVRPEPHGRQRRLQLVRNVRDEARLQLVVAPRPVGGAPQLNGRQHHVRRQESDKAHARKPQPRSRIDHNRKIVEDEPVHQVVHAAPKHIRASIRHLDGLQRPLRRRFSLGGRRPVHPMDALAQPSPQGGRIALVPDESLARCPDKRPYWPYRSHFGLVLRPRGQDCLACHIRRADLAYRIAQIVGGVERHCLLDRLQPHTVVLVLLDQQVKPHPRDDKRRHHDAQQKPPSK